MCNDCWRKTCDACGKVGATFCCQKCRIRLCYKCNIEMIVEGAKKTAGLPNVWKRNKIRYSLPFMMAILINSKHYSAIKQSLKSAIKF